MLQTTNASEAFRHLAPSYTNDILRALSAEDAERLLQRATKVDLRTATRLYEAGDEIDWVYFPEGALLSLVVATADGRTAESGMAGPESAMGLVEACGSGRAALTCIVQGPGPAWRVPASACRSLADRSDLFRAAVWGALEFQLIEARQSATCRSFHPVEERLARWLLECRDRDGGEEARPMTQEFMGSMLGVQRTTVTAFAKKLQGRGFIHYSRGRVRLIDLDGLENLACECRGVLAAERKRLNSDG